MANNYYNEEENNKLIADWRLTGNENSRETALLSLFQISSAILYRYKFFRFENKDDLLQISNEAIIKQFDRWDPTFKNKKGKATTSFNYFSKVAQQSMYYFTIKGKKNRNLTDLDSIKEVGITYPHETYSVDHLRDDYYSHFTLPQSVHLLSYFNHLIDFLYLERVYNRRHFNRYLYSHGPHYNIAGKVITNDWVVSKYSRIMMNKLRALNAQKE